MLRAGTPLESPSCGMLTCASILVKAMLCAHTALESPSGEGWVPEVCWGMTMFQAGAAFDNPSGGKLLLASNLGMLMLCTATAVESLSINSLSAQQKSATLYHLFVRLVVSISPGLAVNWLVELSEISKIIGGVV